MSTAKVNPEDQAPAEGDAVKVPLHVLESAAGAISNFVSDHGWADSDMQAMDNLLAYIARHKANAAANVQPKHTDAELESRTGEPHIDGWPLYSGLPPAQSPAPAPEVPAGMVLVPRELTPEMLNAACEADDIYTRWDVPEMWGAMLAAAPPAQAPAVAHAGLSLTQEPKYTVNGHAIVNRASGEEIPADEPVFIFRARDKWAAGVLGDYCGQFCNDPEHIAAVEARFIQFSEWAEAHPERMKEPDTAPVSHVPVQKTGGE